MQNKLKEEEKRLLKSRSKPTLFKWTCLLWTRVFSLGKLKRIFYLFSKGNFLTTFISGTILIHLGAQENVLNYIAFKVHLVFVPTEILFSPV